MEEIILEGKIKGLRLYGYQRSLSQCDTNGVYTKFTRIVSLFGLPEMDVTWACLANSVFRINFQEKGEV